jgi:signal transduction histidine kinase/ActR/RegA family two-component response regulator
MQAINASKNTLKANFALIMLAFIIAIMVVCAVTLIASRTTSRAVKQQNQILKQYHLAYDLSNAVQDIVYRSADLSNSLSDDALNAFLASRKKLDQLSKTLADASLADFIGAQATLIANNSLIAMDNYINNDRNAGDGIMRQVRSNSNALRDRVLAHQKERLTALETIQQKTITINKVAERFAIAFTALAVLVSSLLMLIVYRVTIRPIQIFISSLKHAAIEPGKAKGFRAIQTSGGELGEAATALNSLLDATENALEQARSQAQMAKRSEARWKAIFNLSPDAIILLDQKSTKIMDCNPATISMLDLAEKDFTRFSAYDFHEHEKDKLGAFLSDVSKLGHARADHLSCKLGDDIVPVSVIGVDVPSENEHATMLYIRDMSQIVARRRELETAQQEAEAASEAKSAFLATMSHEIRTPLNGMLGMAQALKFSELPAVDAEKVDTIIESGDLLLTLLNDVLDISKISAGQMEISTTPSDLGELARQTHRLFSAQAEKKNLDFTLCINPDLPQTLDFDPVRVRQCLNNLVSNALKFTNQGKVNIEVFLHDKNAHHYTLGMRVSDTGIGMDAEACEHIFSAFMQADTSISRKFGGTGLGLSITNELAHMMDGSINIQSTPGEGSCFTFLFKAEQSLSSTNLTNAAARKPAISSLSGRRVLLVDDSATNRKVIHTLLSATGIEITEAENGHEALEQLENKSFDLVFLDIHMPVMNGLDTIAAIRSSEEKWHDMPVIAVTADAKIGENNHYLDYGLDGCISKPVDQRLLLAHTFRAINKERNKIIAAVKTG